MIQQAGFQARVINTLHDLHRFDHPPFQLLFQPAARSAYGFLRDGESVRSTSAMAWTEDDNA